MRMILARIIFFSDAQAKVEGDPALHSVGLSQMYA